ncbi:ankyrin repeat domain-containing protein [Candidatus Hepatincolaceae symbiont of Richtersius coronifer]
MKILNIDELTKHDSDAKPNKKPSTFSLILKVGAILVGIICIIYALYTKSYYAPAFKSYEGVAEVTYISTKISDEDFLRKIMSANKQEVEHIMQLGGNPKAVDATNRNAMILAAMFNGKPNLISVLKKHSVNINHKDINGYNSIMMNILSNANTYAFSKELIKHGADVNALTNSGISVLMVAVGSSNDEKVIEQLIQAGAQVNYMNKEGVTSLMIAAKMTTNPKIIELLLKQGAHIGIKDSVNGTVYDLARNNPALNKNSALLKKLR